MIVIMNNVIEKFITRTKFIFHFIQILNMVIYNVQISYNEPQILHYSYGLTLFYYKTKSVICLLTIRIKIHCTVSCGFKDMPKNSLFSR